MTAVQIAQNDACDLMFPPFSRATFHVYNCRWQKKLGVLGWKGDMWVWLTVKGTFIPPLLTQKVNIPGVCFLFVLKMGYLQSCNIWLTPWLGQWLHQGGKMEYEVNLINMYAPKKLSKIYSYINFIADQNNILITRSAALLQLIKTRKIFFLFCVYMEFFQSPLRGWTTHTCYLL